MSPSSLATQTSAAGTTLYLTERLTVLEALDFKAAFLEVCQTTPPPPQIVLDFERTGFMDSSGVGALVAGYKAARDRNIPLQLCNAQPPVLAVLKLTGLDTILPLVDPGQSLAESPPLDPADPPHHPPAHRHVLRSPAAPPRELRSREAWHRGDDSARPPQTHPSVRSWLKRLMDVVGALLGLAVTGLLFVPIAIAIRLDSRGPILFSQVRCGWLGRRFRLWKFRSMVTDAEARRHEVKNQAEGAFFKNDNDPRITRVGRFLRRSSLDEFPQFWNVLLGEMSLVGTRPPTPDEVERYEIPQWQRLNVRPGMTGEWQVNGRSSVKHFEDVIRLDLDYQRRWSLRHDIKLILKTILIIFNRNSGAM